MTDQASLERAYRRLLAWYPRPFRREYGPEIVAVLLTCARAGQRRPGLAESADLIRSGLRMRLRPGGPRPARTVLAAVRLMYAGAAVSTAFLINYVYMTVVLASIDDNKIHHMRLPELTGTFQVPHMSPVSIATGIVSGLAPIAAWLWMARMAGQRRNWARIAAAALFGLATLEVSLLFTAPRAAATISQAGIPGGLALTLLTWPVGAAAVWLLWRPAATAFFQPKDLVQAEPPGFPPSPPRPGGETPRTDRP
jgi:hypothetical protein